MYSKSSTFLALTSILAILAVLSIAINDLGSASVRKPFSSSGKDLVDANGQIALPNGWDSLTGQGNSEVISSSGNISADDKIIQDEFKLTPEDQKYFQENFKNLDVSAVKLNFDDSSVVTKTVAKDNSTQPISNLNKVLVEPITSTAGPTPSNPTDLLVRNVNDESLRLAGYSDFVIKPKPFDGKLFGAFDISMLGSLNIIEKNVIENRNGNEVKVLTVYEFQLGNKDTAQEIYDYLKAKITNELGITINVTNQFGLSSFFINFGVPTDSAFLVVKMRDNVYALSYPKAKYGNKDYLVLTSALLKELI